MPLRGRFWVRESDGAVLRSRTQLAFSPAGAPGMTLGAPEGSMAVTTEYGESSGLGLLAPFEMIETLEWRTEQARRVTSSGPASRFSGVAPPLVVIVHGSIEGRARYSAFRRIGREDGPATP